MKTTEKVLVGVILSVAIGLLVISCKDKPAEKPPVKENDPQFDTTELSTGYHYIHNEIKK